MDNLQLWIYIIFGILYFLSRSMRKNKSNRKPISPLETQENQEKRPPVSFEDLLREITEQRNEETAQAPREISDTTAADTSSSQSENRPKPASKSSRNVISPSKDEESKKIYEKSIAAASEEEPITFERDRHFKAVVGDTHTKDASSTIKQWLSNPQEAKKAIILSEILNRKY